jgi:hypothetical protein
MNAPRHIAAGHDINELPRPRAGAAIVCPVAGKGRGVRALRKLMPGDIVEVAPTIELSLAEAAEIEDTPVGPYYFEHPLDADAGIVVLGLTSTVNHADVPNAVVEWLQQAGCGWFAVLRIVQPVTPGEEITHRYQCPPWFEVVT